MEKQDADKKGNKHDDLEDSVSLLEFMKDLLLFVFYSIAYGGLLVVESGLGLVIGSSENRDLDENVEKNEKKDEKSKEELKFKKPKKSKYNDTQRQSKGCVEEMTSEVQLDDQNISPAERLDVALMTLSPTLTTMKNELDEQGFQKEQFTKLVEEMLPSEDDGALRQTHRRKVKSDLT